MTRANFFATIFSAIGVIFGIKKTPKLILENVNRTTLARCKVAEYDDFISWKDYIDTSG